METERLIIRRFLPEDGDGLPIRQDTYEYAILLSEWEWERGATFALSNL